MQIQMSFWKNNEFVEVSSSILLQNRSKSHIKESDENDVISRWPILNHTRSNYGVHHTGLFSHDTTKSTPLQLTIDPVLLGTTPQPPASNQIAHPLTHTPSSAQIHPSSLITQPYISCPPYKSFQAVALDTPQPSSSGEPTGCVNEGVCKRPLQPYNKIKASALRDLDVPTVLEPKLTAETDYQVSQINALSTSTLATVSASVTLKPSNPPNVTASPKPSRSINEIVSDNVPPHLLDPSCLVGIPCVYDACDGTSVFRGRKAWRLHLREYHGVPGGASARGVCLYPGCDQVRAKMKGGLLRHIIADHSQVGLQCRQCDRNPFMREDPLVRHYKRVHRDQYFEDRHDVVYSDEVEV